MASQGPSFPGTVEQTGIAPENAEAWVNPGNIVSDNGSEATVTAATYDSGDFTNILIARNFGFTIPAGATIDGVVVEIEQRRFAGAARDGRVQLRSPAGALVGDFKGTATAWPGTATIATYGGTTDDWNAGFDDADINDAQFGVVLSVEATAANTDIGVDFIRMTVHYTEASSGDATGSGSPSSTLSSSATGAATHTHVGSGTPTDSLSSSTTGVATQTFSGSGTPSSTLSSSATGNALQNASVGSGSPTSTLSSSAAGAATQTFNASGAPTSTLSSSAAGAATHTHVGTGTPTSTLSSSATGEGTMTPDAIVAQIARPDADLFISGFTEDDGTTVNLFDQINESSRNDASFIRMGSDLSQAIAVFRLSALGRPDTLTGGVLRYAMGKTLAGGRSLRLTAQLRSGYVDEDNLGTLLDEWVTADVGVIDLVEQALDEAVVDAIPFETTELSIRFIAEQIAAVASGALTDSLSSSATGAATMDPDVVEGTSFFLADAEAGTLAPFNPPNPWSVVQFRGTITNSTARAASGSRSYRYEVTSHEPATIGHDTRMMGAGPNIQSMGGPSGHFMSGWYSMDMFIEDGFEADGWEMIFGWMTGDSGAPSPIAHVELRNWPENSSRVLQLVFVLKGATFGLYTAPEMPGYSNQSNGFYFQTASSPNGITPFPRNQWVHLDFYYEMAAVNGKIQIWQDGVKVIDMQHPAFNLFGGHSNGLTNNAGDMIFQHGMYGSPKSDGVQRIYIDNVRVTDFRVSA